jgi:hypothetical protein
MAHRYQKMLVNRITLLSQPLPEIAAAPPHEGREANKSLKHLEDHPIGEYGLRRETYLEPILRSCKLVLQQVSESRGFPSIQAAILGCCFLSGERASVVKTIHAHPAINKPLTQRVCCDSIVSSLQADPMDIDELSN